MATLEFKKEDLVNLVFGDESPLELVEEGKWEDEGKHSYKDFIFKYEGKFYEISLDRSGSYFTDYEYGHEYWDDMVQCAEVVREEKVINVWVSADSVKVEE